MSERTDSSEGTITAAVPYLRGDLSELSVDFSQRVLGNDLLDRRPLPIRDGRKAPQRPVLDREGFEIITAPCPVVHEDLAGLIAERPILDFSDAQRRYWRETLPRIQALTGARDVLPVHASAVRYSDRAHRAGVMTPAGWAHLDYEKDEAEAQLSKTLQDNRFEPQPFSRYVLYQGWRALSRAPQDFPLALCDGRTVSSEDFVPVRYHLKTEDREVTYRANGCRFSANHDWWYFPDMGIDEMIVFKGFDSALGDDFRTLHVAIEDTTRSDAIPRISIETRYFALFD